MKRKRVISLLIYAIAMAYVEALVVVYLRKLVPLEIWEKATSYQDITRLIQRVGIMWSEQTREFATIVMLGTVAYLFGRSKKEKWAGFLISFGVWDIFYYIFLYLWIQWPSSLLTQDVLFLIPLPWVAPVIVPITISVILILWGSLLLIPISPLSQHRLGK
ncbi:MAG: hypothetical protein GXO71_03010 [Caldiserica bacterium]|nr:hypothetical protein [Caldisericota bacterium]